MADVGMTIQVSANVTEAIRALGGLNDNLVEIATEGTVNIQSLSLALQDLRNAARNAGNTQELGLFNRAIADLSQQARNLKQVGLGDTLAQTQQATGRASQGFSALGLTMGQSRVAFIDTARAITGQGFSLRSLASNMVLLGPAGTVAFAAIYGLVEVLSKQTDAEKKASEEAKRLAEVMLNLKSAQDISTSASGSAQGEIARVQDLAAAIRDANSSYAERNRALQELREINKSYFGDLTLETSSMGLLAQRVKDYSDALVTEAIIKGQTEEISKMSQELFKQVQAENQLKDARDRANAALAAQGDLAEEATNRGAAAAGVSVGFTGRTQLVQDAKAAQDAFTAQQTVVDRLRGAIAEYNSELQKNIGIQLDQKPLQIPPDTDKSLESLLSKIVQIKAELAKPVTSPLFEQLKNAQNAAPGSEIAAEFREKIAEAIKEGQKNGTADGARYAAELASLYQQQLDKIRTPNLASRIQGIVDVTADPLAGLESKIEKSVGKGALNLRLPVHLELDLEEQGLTRADAQKVLHGLETDPQLAALYKISVPQVQVDIQKFLINKENARLLQQQITETFTSAAEAGFADIGKAIGGALGHQKNPLQAAIKDFTSVLGEGLVKIGEQMIAASTLMQGLHAALGGLWANPAAGIVEGVAAIALGTLIKDVGAHAFASGGIVTGPTVGLVGEAGPEAIMPLSKISDFMRSLPGNSNNSTNSGGVFTLRGQDLVLAVNRANKNLSFVGKASSL